MTRYNNYKYLPKIERWGLVLSIALSPLWFINIFGVNLNPSDLIVVAIFTSFLIRSGTLRLLPSRNASLALSGFIGIAGASVLWAPEKFSALLNYLQYILIFLVVVPITAHILKSERSRRGAFLSLWLMTNLLSLLAAAMFLFGEAPELRKVTLWYSNQNHVYWLVASGFIFNISLIQENLPISWLKPILVILGILQLYLVFGGLTLSAILMMSVGAWLSTAWALYHRPEKWPMTLFSILTGFAVILGLGIVIQYWDRVYLEASLHVRIPHYVASFKAGITHFPLGVGLESSNTVFTGYPETYPRSIHNFFLAYFVELGVIGAISFTVLLIIWFREVFCKFFSNINGIQPFEFAFVSIFSSYILVIMFQPVPIHRYWWYIFGVSWSVIIHQHKS
jgi:O-antigen ligase